MGDEGLRIFNGFTFNTAADERTTAEIVAKFDTFVVGEVNETYERFVFNQRVQKGDESFETFLSAIRNLVKTCNYHQQSRDSIMRDRIVLGIHDKETQNCLLREPQLTLDRCIAMCKTAELARVQMNALNPVSSVNKLSSERGRKSAENVRSSGKRHYGKPRARTADENDHAVMDCKFCGRMHPMRKNNCPAWGKTCSKCGGENHFSVRCTGKIKVHAVELTSDDDEDEDNFLLNVSGNTKQQLTAKLAVNSTPIRFLLDTGADLNTVCQRFVKPEDICPTTGKLIMWKNTHVKPIGEATLTVQNVRTGEHHSADFIIVPNDPKCLLGCKTLTDMRLITVNSALSYHMWNRNTRNWVTWERPIYKLILI